MANKTLPPMTNDLLMTFYKQSISYYACRKFILPNGDTFESTPEELATEIERREKFEPHCS